MDRRISEELYFNDELRKCLNDAGLSDKAWNYWYQRVHKAHDQAIDRVTAAQRVENAKLQELVQYILDECYGDEWFCEKAEELGLKANY